VKSNTNEDGIEKSKSKMSLKSKTKQNLNLKSQKQILICNLEIKTELYCHDCGEDRVI